MKVSGSATLHAPREKVWEALNDPAVLVRTIPGCQQLEETGPDAYRMTVYAGVASIKGSYLGTVRLADQQPPGAFTLHAAGAGSPGTVQAEVQVRLSDDPGDGEEARTRLEYDADAVVGGPVGGVGQRVLSGVAKKTAGEFFKAVDDVLTGVAPAQPAPGESAPAESAPAGSGDADGVAAAGVPAQRAPEQPGVWRAPTPPPGAPGGGGDFLRGTVFGAVVALAGVVVGGLLARRTRP
jgi:carbon monoxide dehydrogenase subunit G